MLVSGQIVKFYIINVPLHIFKCKIPFEEMYISRLNIMSAGNMTDIVRSSPFLATYRSVAPGLNELRRTTKFH